MVYVVRTRMQESLAHALEHHPIVAVLGCRQVGKTTLVRQLCANLKGDIHFFDLEDPRDAARLNDPGLALRHLTGTVVLDEVQRVPEIFRMLRVLADRRPLPARFVVLGSASPELLRQSSESLAGRLTHFELSGFSLDEVPPDDIQSLWHRGGFPASFLAQTDALSFAWRQDFQRTYLSRDLSLLDLRLPPETLTRFWAMLAHYHGQIWNGAEFARAFAMSTHTVRRYLDLLTSLYLVRQLQPHSENIGKRQVKSPKVYLNDSGILHSLLGIANASELQRHPKIGASWEGFAIDAVLRKLNVRNEEAFFWSTHNGAEVDLLIFKHAKRLAFEVKLTEAPRMTRSIRIAMEDLRLDHCFVLHAGRGDPFPLAEDVTAVSVWSFAQPEPLGPMIFA